MHSLLNYCAIHSVLFCYTLLQYLYCKIEAYKLNDSFILLEKSQRKDTQVNTADINMIKLGKVE